MRFCRHATVARALATIVKGGPELMMICCVHGCSRVCVFVCAAARSIAKVSRVSALELFRSLARPACLAEAAADEQPHGKATVVLEGGPFLHSAAQRSSTVAVTRGVGMKSHSSHRGEARTLADQVRKAQRTYSQEAGSSQGSPRASACVRASVAPGSP